ncbi:hypothetical protein H8S90_09090 [Olivibacter sp. SDN3]|uniref:hypothetical protein n=1 Tax=Olivibacter sp. SDN3 TaxID=2764720 RepID=UPI001651762A|nr:hypothetical protein [Olivibacter sp. SDN3]QNL51706.1 hypothetical protein H8S90_09090 [Olivibacter sp. SDN3]
MEKSFSYFHVQREDLLRVVEVLKVKRTMPSTQTGGSTKARFVLLFLRELEKHAREYNVSYYLLDNITNRPCFFTSNIAELIGYDNAILPDSWRSYFMQMIQDREIQADVEGVLRTMDERIPKKEIDATTVVVCGMPAVNLKGRPIRFCYVSRAIYKEDCGQPLIMFDRISDIYPFLKEEGFWIRVVTPSCVYS